MLMLTLHRCMCSSTACRSCPSPAVPFSPVAGAVPCAWASNNWPATLHSGAPAAPCCSAVAAGASLCVPRAPGCCAPGWAASYSIARTAACAISSCGSGASPKMRGTPARIQHKGATLSARHPPLHLLYLLHSAAPHSCPEALLPMRPCSTPDTRPRTVITPPRSPRQHHHVPAPDAQRNRSLVSPLPSHQEHSVTAKAEAHDRRVHIRLDVIQMPAQGVAGVVVIDDRSVGGEAAWHRRWGHVWGGRQVVRRWRKRGGVCRAPGM